MYAGSLVDPAADVAFQLGDRAVGYYGRSFTGDPGEDAFDEVEPALANEAETPAAFGLRGR